MSQANSQPAEQAATNMPLFFKKPVPLQTERHAKAAIRTVNSYGFARDTNSIPITAHEMTEAAKHYPIVFSSDAPVMPMVIVGLQRNNNFVQKDGAWVPNAYIPAYVRKYPFVFMDVPNEDKFMLCVDEDSPHFSAKGGDGAHPLYNGKEASDLTRNALQFCSSFQEQYDFTRRFCEKLAELGLLSAHQSSVEIEGKKLNLSGFQLIDIEKLNKLPDETTLELHKAGYLPAIHYALQSLSNWTRLLDLEPKQGKKSS